MSKKPRIFGTCSAGCLWETVHKDDFLKSASIVDLHNNGETQYVDVTNKYRIGSEAESQAISTLTATLPSAANGIAAAAVGTKVYLFGGSYAGGALKTINVFDTASNSITTLTTTLPKYTTRMAAAAVGTKIYLFGGLESALSPLNTIIVFDTTNNSITTLTTTLPTVADNIAAVAVGTKIYLLGGLTGTSLENYSSLNTINVFDTANNSITTLTTTLPTAAVVSAAAVGTKIFVFRASVTDVFDTANNSITTLPTTLPTAAVGSAAAVGTRIYLFGGYDTSSVNTINVFDTKDNSVTTLPTTLPTAADTIAAVAVGTKTYLFGGKNNSTNLNTINVFNGDNIKCAVSLTYGIESGNSEYPFDLDTTYYDAIKKLFTFEIVSATVNSAGTVLTVVYDVTDGAAKYKRYTVDIPGVGLSIANSKIKVSGATSLYAYNQDAEILEAGDSVFIRYSANADGTDYTETWTSGQNYIGVAAGKTEPADKTGYTWSQFCSTEDGEIEDIKQDIEEMQTKFVEKVTSRGQLRVYGINPIGGSYIFDVNEFASASTIVRRGDDGTISTADPVDPPNAVNKQWLEKTLDPLKSQLSNIWTILENTIINVTTVEDAYNTRVTAGGLTVVDEALTTVHKIAGATTVSVNLLPVDTATLVSNGVTFDASGATGAVHITGSITEGATYAAETICYFDLLPGTYTLYTPHKQDKVGWIIRNANNEKVEEISWNGTPTQVVFTITAAGKYSLYSYVHSSLSGELDYTETPMLLRGDVSAALPAFAPYYAGVSSAVLHGIVSTGRNLLAVTQSKSMYNGGLVYESDVSTGTVTITGTAVASGSASSLFNEFYLPRGAYTLYMPNKANGYGIGWNIKTVNHHAIAAVSWNASQPYGTFTVEEAGKFYLLAYASSAAVDVNYTETPMILHGTVTENFPAFEKYNADTSFALTTPVTLGKWDTIDVDAGKRIVGTVTETSETPYTEEQLVQFDDYILSADGKTVAYRTAAVTETPLSLPKTYKAWHGGCEYVTADAAGGQNGDDLKFTVTQDYYEEVSKA